MALKSSFVYPFTPIIDNNNYNYWQEEEDGKTLVFDKRDMAVKIMYMTVCFVVIFT